MEVERLRQRAKKKLLRVTFPNGKVICCSKSVDTMIEALVEIGAERFPLNRNDDVSPPITI